MDVGWDVKGKQKVRRQKAEGTAVLPTILCSSKILIMTGREHMQRGGVWAALVLFVLAAVGIGAALPVGFGGWLDNIAGLILFLFVAGLLMGITAVIKRLLFSKSRAEAWWIIYLLVGTFGAVAILNSKAVLIVAFVALPLLCLGLGVGAARNGRWRQRAPIERIGILFVVLLSGCLLVIMLVGGIMAGNSDHLAERPFAVESNASLSLENPGEPGPYPVLTLTYGSGLDSRRPEFGKQADMQTAPVDGSAFLEGTSGWVDVLRKWYWGFDQTTLPLNGTIWYPDSEGPFPLVLILHGNHEMEEVSDPGYAWLGKLLASQGFVVAVIDENFLNYSWRGGDLNDEVDARAWLALQHLAQMREWQEQDANPLAGRVDLSQIALIGHSRGGETAAVAALFNQLAQLQEDANIELPSDFGIQAVIALAPTDGKYQPASQPLVLYDVNYLLLHGGHDADLTSFPGESQWQRVQPGDDQFKVSVWAYRANHGQFNTVWGQYDMPWPLRLIQNRMPLMAGEDQRQFAGTVISAFLRTTLLGESDYEAISKDLDLAAEWLPDDIYLTRYEDDSFQVLADFQEDVDVTTGSLPGIYINTHNLQAWYEDAQKQNDGANVVAYVGWYWDSVEPKRDDAPVFSISVSDAELAIDESSWLYFSLADMGRLPDSAASDGQADFIDLSVELVDENGRSAQIPLSTFQPLMPPLPTKVSKLTPATNAVILQTVALPLVDFLIQEPALDLESLTAVTLLFDQTPQGLIMVDDISISTPIDAQD
jgi:dienelactone hydrolase